MSKVGLKIEQYADTLQEMMESNLHLEQPDTVEEAIGRLSFYWAFLDDELKDYVHCARHALETKAEWNV